MTASESLISTDLLDRLRAADLTPTSHFIGILQPLHNAPDQWFSAEALYRELLVRGPAVTLGTLYRLVNKMSSRELLLRRVDENGKRFFRLRPDESLLHRIVNVDTGDVLAMTDDTSPSHMASILRSQGLMLAGVPMTVHVQCIKETNLTG